MSASTGFGSEPKGVCSLEEEQVSTCEIPSSFKESAWDTFRANLKQRHRRVQSRSSSSPSPIKTYEQSMAKFPNNSAHQHLCNVPRTGDEEESKFGKSLIGLMQRSGRFDYCDFSEGEQTQTQQENSDDNNSSSNNINGNGSVWRLIQAAGVGLTWRNLSNQTPCCIRKVLSPNSPR